MNSCCADGNTLSFITGLVPSAQPTVQKPEVSVPLEEDGFKGM